MEVGVEAGEEISANLCLGLASFKGHQRAATTSAAAAA